MKSTRLLLLIQSAALAGLVASCSHSDSDDAEAPKAPLIQNGKLSLDAATQERIGLEVQALNAVEIKPRHPLTGRVVDATILAAQAADFVTTQAAAAASQAEFKRSRTLAAENNASARALEAAEAAAARDQAQADAARIKLAATWGPAIANRSDLARLLESLAATECALVRVDLPAGDILHGEAPQVKLFTLAGEAVDATFLGAALAVDPQTQGRSWFFLIQPNPARLLSGMAVSGYVEESGATLHGVLVPRDAVVRYIGEGWVYQVSNETNFVRTQIPLVHPVDQGWFISGGLSPGNRIVVTGAQSVLSRELNGTGFQSGERD